MLGDVLAMLRSEGADAAAAALGPAVLVGKLPGEDSAWAFRTLRLNPMALMVEPPPRLVREGLMLDMLVWPLRKKGDSRTFRDQVLVGRANANDVILPHPSVSKLHARVRFADGKVFVEDADSANGVLVNGQPAGAGGLPLTDRSTLVLGSVSLRFLSTPALLDLLSSAAPRT